MFDKIGDMPLHLQARLLRVLENGEFIRVGSSKVQKTDVRVVAATNVNLLDRVQAGTFREDLYYRLNTVPITVPPLRERGDDIYLLFRKFASDAAERYRTRPITLLPDAVQALISPGAVVARDGLLQGEVGAVVVEGLQRDGLVADLAGGVDGDGMGE